MKQYGNSPISKSTPPFSTNPLFLSNFFMTPPLLFQISKTRYSPNFMVGEGTMMLLILLSILTAIRHLICGNNLNWLLNLYLIYKTLWTGVKIDLLISVLRKLSWFHLTGLITMVLLM